MTRHGREGRARSRCSRHGPAAIAAAVLVVAACSRHGRIEVRSPRDPREAPLALYALARAEEPRAAALAAVLSATPVGPDRAALDLAIAPLREAEPPRVTATEPMAGTGRIAVDFDAALSGGGVLRGSVQVVPAGDGTFRVAWLATPGGSWPPTRPVPGEGLSSSTIAR